MALSRLRPCPPRPSHEGGHGRKGERATDIARRHAVRKSESANARARARAIVLTNVIVDFENLVDRSINIVVPKVFLKKWVLQEFCKKNNGFCI